MRRAWGFVLMVSLLSGCASTDYTPIKSGRVAMTSKGYVRDGVTYPNTFGGLADAVKDNPRAHAKAEHASNLFTNGLITGGLGLAGEVGGIVLVATGTKHDDRTGETTMTSAVPIGAIVFVAGLALHVTSSILFYNSTAHAADAMNIYNDDVELKRAAPPPPAAPGPRLDAVPSAPSSAAPPNQVSPSPEAAPSAPTAPAP